MATSEHAYVAGYWAHWAADRFGPDGAELASVTSYTLARSHVTGPSWWQGWHAYTHDHEEGTRDDS